ncbi:hypothetical protein D9M68_812540 [compost metagenome]
MLTGDIGLQLLTPHTRHIGTNVDDRPLPLAQHGARRLAGQEVARGEVDFKGLAPIFQGRLQQRLPKANAGVVDQDIELPMATHDFGDSRDHRGFVGEIEGQAVRATALPLDFLRHR